MRPTLPEGEGLGFRCGFCGRSFPDLPSLQRHLVQGHAGRPFPPRCDVCGLRFDTPADLKEHNQGVHGAPVG